MRARLIIGIALAIAAGALGIYVASNESTRRAAQRQVEQSSREADAIRARWQAEQRALEAQLVEAAAAKPLLAALDDHVDGPTLVDLFRSEDWWRGPRAEFSLTRVMVGDDILASYGVPDPGNAARAIAATARAERIASSLVELGGRPYFLLAARLPALPGRDPILVVAKAVDTVHLGVIMPAPPVPSRGMKDLAAASGAGALIVTAAAILLFGLGIARRRPPVVMRLPVPGMEPREPTLRLGSMPRGVSAPYVPRAGGPASPGASIQVRGSAPPLLKTPAAAAVSASGAPSSSSVPPPRTMPVTPGPVGPPRRATAADGVPTSETGSPGKRFGRYQLLDRLGEGGMSEVFTAAAHGVEGFSRVFVLKRLRPELARDREAIGQFIDEARMQANLVHSNIVPVFDFGQVGDEFFMTQEYIVGRDLVRLIARTYDQLRQALSPRLSYYFTHETLLALQYAHTKADREGRPLGIVHRDVSPANVIVSAQGEVKLSDFGIVKSNHRITRTQAGMVKGNVNFMSPEQAKGKDVDARSDLFSMGLVLFYCLTNQFFYDGDNDLDVLYKAACGPTQEHRDRLDRLPSPARDILAKALAIDPGERFQSAAEFADSLAPHIGVGKSEAAKLMKTLFGQELLREAA